MLLVDTVHSNNGPNTPQGPEPVDSQVSYWDWKGDGHDSDEEVYLSHVHWKCEFMIAYMYVDFPMKTQLQLQFAIELLFSSISLNV